MISTTMTAASITPRGTFAKNATMSSRSAASGMMPWPSTRAVEEVPDGSVERRRVVGPPVHDGLVESVAVLVDPVEESGDRPDDHHRLDDDQDRDGAGED